MAAADRCSECGNGNIRTTESRPSKRLDARGTRRRKECLSCGHRWTTYEFPAELIESLFVAAELKDKCDEISKYLTDINKASDRVLTLLPSDSRRDSSRDG